MKLRLEKEKIIVRLTPSEIEQFSAAKFLEEKVSLSQTNRFAFALSISESNDKMVVEFKDSSLLILVPIEKLEQWINSNRVGIHEKILTESGAELRLTLEEDLPPRKNRRKE